MPKSRKVWMNSRISPTVPSGAINQDAYESGQQNRQTNKHAWFWVHFCVMSPHRSQPLPARWDSHKGANFYVKSYWYFLAFYLAHIIQQPMPKLRIRNLKRFCWHRFVIGCWVRWILDSRKYLVKSWIWPHCGEPIAGRKEGVAHDLVLAPLGARKM